MIPADTPGIESIPLPVSEERLAELLSGTHSPNKDATEPQPIHQRGCGERVEVFPGFLQYQPIDVYADRHILMVLGTFFVLDPSPPVAGVE